MKALQTKQDYHGASSALVSGGILTYIGGIFLVISFISPYWVQSFDETFSAFKNMGLWQYCFDQFRFPYHQFDKTFDGCHYIYSDEYYVIREWLLPGWLLSVQAWMTMAIILSLASLVIIAMIVDRLPLRGVIHFEWLLTGIVFLLTALTTFLLFISVWLFWTQSSRRDWLMYPNFNHLSYSYYAAVLAFVIHGVATFIFYKDARRAYEFRRESKNLVMQIVDNSRNGGFV